MNYGKTWWGKKWLNAFNDIDLTNRIPRGKTYANTGKVYDIYFNKNVVVSKVEGNYFDYYNTTIMFKEFTKEEEKIIEETINNSPSILSSLLNNQLPKELYYELSKKGIELFPKSYNDMVVNCNCPDYAYVCKHVAGLVYMITIEIDKNPFIIFQLHNCNLDKLIKNKNKIKTKQIKQTKEIINLIKAPKTKNPKINFNQISFDKIPDLENITFSLLKEEPVFYEKDFKKILKLNFTRLLRYVKKIEKYINDTEYYYNITILENKRYQSNNEDFNNEFHQKWNYPEKWETFSLNINKEYKIKEINIKNNKNPFKNQDFDLLLFSFLMKMNYAKINKFNENIQFFYLLNQFTIELIKKHALIPEFFESSKNTYKIRWIPALYDENIQKICNQLTEICPNDLIKYGKRYVNKKDQVICAISLIFSGICNSYFNHAYHPNSLKKDLPNPIFRLFFIESQKFDKYNEQHYQFLINQWLSNFNLKHRDYELFLFVKEENEKFLVELQASINNKTPEKISKIIANNKTDEISLSLIQDNYLIKEFLPELDKAIDSDIDINLTLDEFSSFFINTLPLFKIMGISIILPKELQKIFKPKLVLKLGAIDKKEKHYLTLNDINQFDWKIAIGDNEISKEEFEKLVDESKKLVKIANQYVILEEKEVKTILKQINKKTKLNQNNLMQALLSGEYNNAEVTVDNELKELINNLTQIKDIEIPKSLNATLRDYQKTGYSWLIQNIKSGFGSILADDMGLGKTIQVLTTILYLKNNKMLEKRKVLIVMPTSLLINWQNEIKKFTPDLKAHIYHGNRRKLPKKNYDILLTTYGVIRKDIEKIKKEKWELIVIDEAQNIKNPTTQQTKSIKSIKTKHKIALSGTPIENRLSEYWSIFDFTNKNYLGNAKSFRNNYVIPIENYRNEHVLNNFKQITNPFILRRLKTDKSIINDLPDKVVNDIYCKLTPKQSAIYKETLNSLMNNIKNKEDIERKGLVFKLINALKQICNHPAQFTKTKKITIEDSGKMQILIDILKNIIEADEKVLIFTQFVQMGDIIKELIEEELNTEVLFLHGSLTAKKRNQMVEDFQNKKIYPIFIISLKAGGTGLNLTAAQNVIHYDLWWNPAVENQATDRAFRIGQEKNVMVYRFITKGTFEEKINNMLKEKEELAELAVVSDAKFITEMSNKELKDMLKLRN